jgi:hypothetical protein
MDSTTNQSPVPKAKYPKLHRVFDHATGKYALTVKVSPKAVAPETLAKLIADRDFVVSPKPTPRSTAFGYHGWPLGKHPPTYSSELARVKRIQRRRNKNAMAAASRRKQR